MCGAGGMCSGGIGSGGIGLGGYEEGGEVDERRGLDHVQPEL